MQEGKTIIGYAVFNTYFGEIFGCKLDKNLYLDYERNDTFHLEDKYLIYNKLYDFMPIVKGYEDNLNIDILSEDQFIWRLKLHKRNQARSIKDLSPKKEETRNRIVSGEPLTLISFVKAK